MSFDKQEQPTTKEKVETLVKAASDLLRQLNLDSPIETLGKRRGPNSSKTATKKPPEPLKQRPWELVELIARFELATSSLPRMRSTD